MHDRIYSMHAKPLLLYVTHQHEGFSQKFQKAGFVVGAAIAGGSVRCSREARSLAGGSGRVSRTDPLVPVIR